MLSNVPLPSFRTQVRSTILISCPLLLLRLRLCRRQRALQRLCSNASTRAAARRDLVMAITGGYGDVSVAWVGGRAGSRHAALSHDDACVVDVATYLQVQRRIRFGRRVQACPAADV